MAGKKISVLVAVSHFTSSLNSWSCLVLLLQDVDLGSYVQIVCNVLDIPVYDNPIEALHVLFTLLLEFKSNPAFKASQAGGLTLADQTAFLQADLRSNSQAGLRSESRGTSSGGRQSAEVLAVI